MQASSTIKAATLERHDYQKAGWSRAGGSGALWEHAELAAGGPGGNILSAAQNVVSAVFAGRPLNPGGSKSPGRDRG